MSIKLEEVSTVTYRTSDPIWIGPDGKVYGDDDKPDGSTQLAGVDGEISAKDAEKYGIGKGRKAEEKAVEAPAENKARVIGHRK